MAQPRSAKRKASPKHALSAPRAARVSPSERLDLFAITAPGLETLAAGELHSLGIPEAAAEAGGVAFRGGLTDVYRANLWLRTATRIVARAGEFGARAFYELEKGAKQVPWERWLGGGRPVQIRVTCRKSKLYHSDAVAERVASAIASRAGKAGAITARSGGADIDDDDAAQERGGAQLIAVRMLHDRCTISIDSSGPLLHRRGYRLATAKAPLRETLAAAALFASGWDPAAPLIDPLCGAGTIAIEAALMARGIAPGSRRDFAFMSWPSFDAGLWATVRDDSLASALPAAPAPIIASDRDEGAIAAAAANAERAGVVADLTLSRRALSAIEPPAGPGWLVTNPPYGVRVGDAGGGLRDLYAQLGNTARETMNGWTIAMVSAEPALERATKLGFEPVIKTRNGGIPVRIVVARVE